MKRLYVGKDNRNVNIPNSVPKQDNMAWFKQWASSPFGDSRHYSYR